MGARLGPAHDRLTLPPAKGDVYSREGIDELSPSGGSTVGHKIKLQVPWFLPIPFLGELDRDLLVKQGLGVGVTVLLQAQDLTLMGQLNIDGTRGDLEELCCHLRGTLHLTESAKPFKLGEKQRLEPLPTGVVEDLPQLGQHGPHLTVIDDLPSSPLLLPAVKVA